MADDSLVAALVAAFPNVIEEQMCYAAMGALVLYEHVITFDQEVRLVWRRKVTGATVLFLLNKYLLLARFLVVLSAFNDSSPEVCRGSVLAGDVLQTMPYLVWAAFAALRVYALTDHVWWLAGIIFVVSSVPVATNSYIYSITAIESFIPPFNCLTSFNISKELYLILLILTRCCVILGDLLVLAVSWYKTYSTWKTAASVAMKASFSTMILRDGTIYFLILLTINVLHLVFSLEGLFIDSVVIFQDPVISILVSRFILNLRNLDQSGQSVETGRWSQSIDFAAINLALASSGHIPRGEFSGRTTSSRIAEFVDPLGAPLDIAGHSDDFEAGGEEDSVVTKEILVEARTSPTSSGSWPQILDAA